MSLVLLAWQSAPVNPRLDDALISLDSAQSLVSGADPQYGVPPLVGVTSPPYVLLIAVLLRAGTEPLVALRTATALGLLALALSVWALARAVELPGWIQAVALAAVLSPAAVVDQSTNGVETGWAIAVAVALIAATVARRPLAAAAAAGLLPWLRPDLSVFAAALFVAALWNETWKTRVRSGAAALAIAVPWTVWLHVNTGTWIPQTMAAKAIFFAEDCQPIWRKLDVAAGALGVWGGSVLPSALIAAVWLPRSPLGRIGIASSAIAIGVHAAVLPGGLWHNDGRYLYAMLVPWIAFGAAIALQRGAVVTRAAVAAAIAANFALWTVRDPARDRESGERVAMGRWVDAHVSDEARILVHDAGMFAVFTGNPLVDMVGLKRPASIDVHREFTRPSCGAKRAEAVARIARLTDVDYVVLTAEWDDSFGLAGGLILNGVPLEKVETPYTRYKLYKVRRPVEEGGGGIPSYSRNGAANPEINLPGATLRASHGW